ncbi:MAG TPA: tRNA uracil 4-sulfurtransferase ThiI [Limnochordia bacterium]|nr:tRNA uracil 4-sulfurtransferase ThiI [Limnochordia bacterium]
MYPLLLVRYGELSLKGRNRKTFEDLLITNIRAALGDLPHGRITKTFGRIYVETKDNWEELAARLQQVFGIVSLSPVVRRGLDLEEIKEGASLVVQDTPGQTFKVETRRACKDFPLSSPELSRTLGGHLLKSFPHLKVDVHNPDFIVKVEVRSEGAFIYSKVIPCLGGLPAGSSGKGLLLLSGGIDSPVAGFLSMKRGVDVEGIHFHSYPFTSQQSKEKVVELARILASYNARGRFRLWIAYFTEIQKALHKGSYPSLSVTLMRRFMLRIAARLAQREGALALITGDSLGQVASQTMESIHTINAVTSLPVFRPLIGLDKQEIVEIAVRIGTYETSILPYEDCCTVFVPKNPATKPSLRQVERAEGELDVEGLIAEALEKTELVELYPGKAF